MKLKVPTYLSKLIFKYPSILSGRKNVQKYHERIIKTKELIKEYKNKKKII